MSKQELARLQKEVNSKKADIRKTALAKLKDMPPKDAVPVLMSMLDCKDEDVLADMSKAMLSFKNEALPYLAKALTSEKWSERKAASVILSKLGIGSLNKLMEIIPQNEEDVDYWMVQTLSGMGSDAIPYLTKMFKHPSENIRLAAIRASQNVKDPRMVSVLLPLLEDVRWPVRKAAYDSLEHIYELDMPAVLEALDKYSDEAKYWIIKLLGLHSNPELTGKFAQIVENGPIESKLEAIKALSMIENIEAHKLLVGYLANKSWIIRKTAADAIFEQGLGVSEELLSAIRGPNVDARYWSVKLLANTGEAQIFEEIVKCLHDDFASVRSAACQALGALGDKRALAPLMAVLNDEKEEVRTAAILALSQIGERSGKAEQSPLPNHLRAENMVSCPKCGKMVSREFSFCPFCLEHLRAVSCRNCGRALEPSWRCCPDCGTKC